MRGNNQILVTNDFHEAYQIAEIALLNRVASDFRARAVIVCPNAHLAEERLVSVTQKCRRLGIEATSLIHRRDAISPKGRGGRVMVTTFQSLSIALMSQAEEFEDLVYVLVDRLDLIGEPTVGAMLETLLVTLMGMDQSLQYISIMPPVADLNELSEWLNAVIVRDEKSYVKRIFSVKAFDNVNESLADLTEFVHYRQGQIMILCSNISTCERLARRLAGIELADQEPVLDLRLSPEQRDRLLDLSNEVTELYPTCLLTQELGDVLKRGVAFFHAGVSRHQRRRISQAWVDGYLPVIVMPTGFSIASGLRATVVFLVGVFMQGTGNEISNEEELTMLTEWQLNNVLHCAGRSGIDNEAFGIVVVSNQDERQRVLSKFFETDDDGDIRPLLGEVDSSMDDPENAEDLVLRQLCIPGCDEEDPFTILDRTFWASANRATGVPRDQFTPTDSFSVESLISLRTTKSTEKRADEIDDSAVKVVSMNPTKIEGLVHSKTRNLWHHVVLRTGEGVSCTCESWKYQGIRKHRLCKHLVKFCTFVMQNEDTQRYGASILTQSLRSLEILGELERDGLVIKQKESIVCTDLGNSVAALGVPVKDARKLMQAVKTKKGELDDVLLGVIRARLELPRLLLKRVLESVTSSDDFDSVYCDKDMPGIIENIIEDIQYVNSILLKTMAGAARRGLNRQSLKLNEKLKAMLESIG